MFLFSVHLRINLLYDAGPLSGVFSWELKAIVQVLVSTTCFPDSHCSVCIFSQTPTEVIGLVIYSLNYSDGG